MNQAIHNQGMHSACPICDTPSQYEYSGRDLMFDLHTRYDYFVCPECACVFQSPIPGMDVIASFYPETYTVFDQENRTRNISKLRKAFLQRMRG